MAAVAKNPAFAKKVGVKPSVGEHFLTADKDKKFKMGGLPASINKQKTHHTAGGVPNFTNKAFKKGGETMKHDDIKQDMPMMKKVAKQEVKSHEKKMHGMKKGGCVSMCRGGGIEVKGKTKGKMV